MKFAATISYTPDQSKIVAIRPTHREYLTGLLKAGKLVAAGPFTDDSGALIIYEADTVEQAEEFIKGDPFCTGGVFLKWEIRPWRVVFANRELFPVT
jgi:hypothetical protein